jgi:hypothetical protein
VRHVCFVCKRDASIFDRQIGEWVCEGNADCAISRNVPRDQPTIPLADPTMTDAPCGYPFKEKLPAKSSTYTWNLEGTGNPKGGNR